MTKPTIQRHPKGYWYALTPDGGFIQGSVGSKTKAQSAAREWYSINWDYEN